MKIKDKNLASIHMVVLILLIYWNYYTNSGEINGNTVGSVSDAFDNLFTPAGYAFAIWGAIYLGLIALGIYLLYCSFHEKEDSDFVSNGAPTLILAHLGNAAWLWFWLHEQSGISVLFMLFILSMLVVTVVRLNMQRWNPPMRFISLVWWPISLYVGWISVATIANIAAHLAHIDWSPFLSAEQWTLVAMSLAAILAIVMIVVRNMRMYGGVVIWALVAIAVRHWDSIPILQWTALTLATLILISASAHAFKNKATLPFVGKPGD